MMVWDGEGNSDWLVQSRFTDPESYSKRVGTAKSFSEDASKDFEFLHCARHWNRLINKSNASPDSRREITNIRTASLKTGRKS